MRVQEDVGLRPCRKEPLAFSGPVVKALGRFGAMSMLTGVPSPLRSCGEALRGHGAMSMLKGPPQPPQDPCDT